MPRKTTRIGASLALTLVVGMLVGTLAGSTGGRYYSAQDGQELARAVKLAALNRLPYDILDASGKVLEEPLLIAANETTTLRQGVEGNKFVIRR
jgi:hypothetical protein